MAHLDAEMVAQNTSSQLWVVQMSPGLVTLSICAYEAKMPEKTSGAAAAAASLYMLQKYLIMATMFLQAKHRW